MHGRPVPTVYNDVRCAAETFVRTVCLIREDNILPYRGYTNFYGFTPKLVLRFVGGDGLAAARSRSGSDTALWCHSLPSRRFATSTPRIVVHTNLTAANGQTVSPYLGRGGACSSRFAKEGYTTFYGFTPKFVLHFVGTVRPAPLCSAQECSILVGGPLKQTARSIVTAAHL